MKPVPPKDAVASFDSASAFLTSLARALEHRDFPYLGQSRLKVPLVYASALLPAPLRRRTYAIASGREGVRPERLGGIDMEQVAAWVAATYAVRQVPAVLLGSSNGAVNHLAAVCGIPWLPQTLLLPVRRPGADPEDIRGAAEFGVRHAPTLLQANPGVQLHHMHDANQDALTSSQMAYFRVKWRRLPAAYERFLEQRLLPGAPVVVVRDASTWPVTRYGDRHVFQLGAQGGMTPEEYLEAPEAPSPDETAAEAEWGLDDGLLSSVHAWADRAGHPVVEIRYAHPQDPAAAVADTVRGWLRGRGEPAERLLVSSFIVHDPWRTITSASVPFWTFFPVRRAADDLAAYLDHTAYDDIDVMLFSHGVGSRGLVDAETWREHAGRARRRGRLLGVDAADFPADFTVFARYARALRSLPDAARPWQPMPVDEALAGLADAARVTVER
ncbi:MAG: hypothetical protein M3237_00555 [Actinomycetota bacterium]|nr:hypothetical protein [Actinomycetota bacterium]